MCLIFGWMYFNKCGVLSNNKIERSNQWGDYPKTVPSAQREKKTVTLQVKSTKTEHQEVKTDVSTQYTCHVDTAGPAALPLPVFGQKRKLAILL